jgi:glucose-6-phosphate 1-dehydrogenase
MWKKFGLPEWEEVVFLRTTSMSLDPVDIHFSYQEAFRSPSPETYETLPLDVLLGDATLFMRADQVEAAWSEVTPILECWEGVKPPDFPNYSSGIWGPETAERIITGDGGWYNPKPEEAIG